MYISVVVLSYNEEKNIIRVLKNIQDTVVSKYPSTEIIVIDDSSDRTPAILETQKHRMKNLVVLHRENKKGLGSAMKEGFRLARGDIVIVTMGDLSDDAKVMLSMVEKIEEGYDIACASRFVPGGGMVNYPALKLMANRFYNLTFSALFSLGIRDMTNAFRAYRKEVVKKMQLESNGFEITAEIILKAKLFDFSMAEVPSVWYGRTSGESKLGSFKISPKSLFSELPKIGWRYGKIAAIVYWKFIKKKLGIWHA
jgi:glycosyltransferase involved in cell wall biosynthesis